MYEDNIYVKNYEAIKKLPGDIGVQLDQYDNAHGIKHDDLARAQYKHWRAQHTGVPELMSADERDLLGI